MIDDPFASVRPRRRTTPAAAPVVDDDPFASVAPRDTLNTYIRNTTAPEPQREPFLSRLGSAAKAFGQQAIDDPIGTVKGIGKGLAQNAVDLGEMTFNPARASARIAVEEQGDPMRMGTRGVGAASLLLAPGLRAAGAPTSAILAGDYAMSAGLGAAQTPDDPSVGATMGLLMNAAVDAPRMGRFLRQDMVPSLDGVTKGLAEELTPRFPMRRDVEMFRATKGTGKVKPIGPVPVGQAFSTMFPPEAVRALGEDAPDVGAAFDQPAPKPGTSERFPDGFTADPTPIPQSVADIPRALGLTAKEASYIMRDDPVAQLRGVLDGLDKIETPMGPVAPRADILFGDDRAFTMPDLPKPKRSIIPSALKPSAVVDDAVGDASVPVQSRAPLPERVPPISTLAPEPTAAALDAPLTPPTAAAMPEVPPARVNAPVEPPAPVAAAVEPPPVREAVPEANPVTAPSKDATVNWKTWFDKDSPGSQTAEARLRSVIESDPDLVKNARGYESMAVTDAKATAAMKELVAELTDDPLAADLPGIRAFVQKHGAAGVPAMKKLIAQNEQALQDASRVLANSTDPQEMALAQQVIDGIEQQQGDLLRGTVKEQANLGRGLNALKLRAKLSTDPDVWLVQAQRSLGDVPMTDAVRNEVRRLARVAADACGGA